MSSVKFGQPLYKVYEPGYHPQRPIIVDEGLESPETVTLRYEEEAARATGGLRGNTPPGLLPMSAYKPQPPQLHGFADAAYTHYPPQSFQSQPTENAASQITGITFGSGGATSQYLGASPVSVLSCAPSAGSAGTRIQLKVASQYDIMAMATPAPYVTVSFGSHKCHTDVVKDGLSQDGCTYFVSAEAPEFVVTNCTSPSNVPLSLSVESASGEELARVHSAGSFMYHDAPGTAAAVVGAGADAGACEGITRKSPSAEHGDSPPQLTVRTSTTNSPNQTHHPLSADSSTNTYAFPHAADAAAAAAVAAVAQAQEVQNNFAATASYSQDSDMLGTYRGTSFTDHYPRATPRALRTPASVWPTYGSLAHDRYGNVRSSAAMPHAHTSIRRPSLTPSSLPSPHAGTPQLVRTSIIQSASPGSGGGLATGGGYSHWSVYPTKAVLTIAGNLDSMSQDWTQEEWDNRRRIVLFRKKQNGSHLEMSFRPVPVGERPPNSICISCIWWAEKGECFVTSVDTIHLLEQLLAAPSRFTVEEKNRIRRNLEGFKPITVSKAKAESEEFFKVIMGFGPPKPRHIEKDVKVFPWKVLGQALKKIISKYSASPSSTVPVAATTTQLLTPVSVSSSYPGLPPTPGSATTAASHAAAAGYVSMANHGSDSLASPRSLSGVSSWVPYSAAPARTLSPIVKPHSSPSSSALRISALPAVYDARSAHAAHLASSYGLPGGPSSHHHISSTIPVTQSHAGHSNSRWDGYDVAASSVPYSSHHSHDQVYGNGYGDSTQRA